jgi:two-component system sensor histidine kinase AtoS
MQCRLTLDPATSPLLGHYDPLRRAFSNIIRNAVEACDGMGEIEILAGPDSGPRGVRVEIRDHGPGIPPAIREHIFDPYTTAKAGGTGLGLALAKQTVDLHHGTIEVGSTPGGGATFTIRMAGL